MSGAQMNLAAATIAGGVGTIFFAAASVFYYQPSFIKPEKIMDAVLTTNQSKARNAVSRLLLNPSSAEFDGLRSVEADGQKYVCGSVRAKDRTGAYAGNRAFVYAVAIDFARIDDDGTIAQRHDAYRTCPVTEQDEKIAQTRMTVSPGAIAAVKTIQKVLPADSTALASLAGGSSNASTGGVGGTMQQQLQHFGGQQTAPSGGQEGAPFKVASTMPMIGDEASWQPGKPPAAWPAFPTGHELAKPGPRLSNADALLLAKEVEQRWAQHKADATKKRPSVDEIRHAERALLAIDPKAADYRAAWAAFVRLRALEREATA
jgi:hypothetical protein